MQNMLYDPNWSIVYQINSHFKNKCYNWFDCMFPWGHSHLLQATLREKLIYDQNTGKSAKYYLGLLIRWKKE